MTLQTFCICSQSSSPLLETASDCDNRNLEMFTVAFRRAVECLIAVVTAAASCSLLVLADIFRLSASLEANSDMRSAEIHSDLFLRTSPVSLRHPPPLTVTGRMEKSYCWDCCAVLRRL